MIAQPNPNDEPYRRQVVDDSFRALAKAALLLHQQTRPRMSPDEQRIAIAEACGWKRHRSPRIRGGWKRPDGSDYSWGENVIPNYLKDLNAMHEAEKALTAPQQDDYYDALTDVITHGNFFADIHATAAQRAEAFLRTIGKWTDSPQ